MPSFERIARDWDASQEELPKQFIELLRNRFALKRDSCVIDIGCGSGIMTFALAEISSNVAGLDSSRTMISIAKSRDRQKRINWIYDKVEAHDIGISKYDLIVSYECFHLFGDLETLIRKLELALKMGGFLCIGWCTHEWERRLRPIIVETLLRYNIDMTDWGYWHCPEFAYLVLKHGRTLGTVLEREVAVKSRSDVNRIATYVTSIDRTSRLSSTSRSRLRVELEEKFREALSSDYMEGFASFHLKYTQRIRR